MKKRCLLCACISALGVLVSVVLSVLILKNLGNIIGIFAESPTQEGEFDFAEIFSQTAPASISVHFTVPVLIFAAYGVLLARFFPKGRFLIPKACMWALYGIVCALAAFSACVLLSKVNGIRTIDVISSLLPMIEHL